MQKSLRVLLNGLIDYAGLFPPAGLEMLNAVQHYAAYAAGPQAWALGRFVLPLTQLAAFEAAWAHLTLPPSAKPWALSALIGPAIADDLAKIAAFNATHHATALCIDCVEVKANTVAEIAAIAQAKLHAPVGRQLQIFVEISSVPDPVDLIAALAEQRLFAKIRTGGLTQAAFPAPNDVLRFMQCCIEHGVAFKATAGLHHPLRGDYNLTYEANCASATMYGYVNVFLAAAILAQDPHAYAPVAAALLLDEDASAFRFSEDGVIWRGNVITCQQLLHLRQHIALSFGACSFSEPMHEINQF